MLPMLNCSSQLYNTSFILVVIFVTPHIFM